MTMTKGTKIGIGIAAVLLVGTILYFVLKPKTKPATSTTVMPPISSLPPDMPDYSIEQDQNQTDRYTIKFGANSFDYNKGDASVTNKLDSAWSIRADTLQQGAAAGSQIVVTIFKNNQQVLSQNYV